MSLPHVTESIPAYALGALDEAETQEVSQHLEHCSACQAELHAYLLLVGDLAQTVPQRQPPVRLRAAVMQKAVAQQVEAKAPASSRKPWYARALSPAAGLAGMVVILVLIATNLVLWQQLQRPPAAPAPAPTGAVIPTPLVVASPTPLIVASPTPRPTTTAYNFRLVRLEPPQPSGASGLLVISDDGEYGTLVVDGLEVLDARQQYQLWLIQDGQRTSGGVFSVGHTGYGVIEIYAPQPLADYQSFGITIEPQGGSPGPTGPRVLAGSL